MIDDLTPLHVAADDGKLNTMQLLINHGADVNALDCQGDSPLHKASRITNSDEAEFLVKSGANVNIRIIDEFNDESTPLHVAAAYGNLNMVQLLIDYGVDVNALDRQGYSPLYLAVGTSSLQQRERYLIAQSLIGRGANVDARGSRHKTPLHLSSLNGSLDMARLLIEHGADVSAQDDGGRTPFSMALASGHRKLARVLSNDPVPA